MAPDKATPALKLNLPGRSSPLNPRLTLQKSLFLRLQRHLPDRKLASRARHQTSPDTLNQAPKPPASCINPPPQLSTKSQKDHGVCRQPEEKEQSEEVCEVAQERCRGLEWGVKVELVKVACVCVGFECVIEILWCACFLRCALAFRLLIDCFENSLRLLMWFINFEV